MEQEGLFRPRSVFRPAPDIIRFGGASIVTAPALIATGIVFGGSAFGSTPGVGSTATGAIIVAGSPIVAIELLFNASGPIVFSGTATGVSRFVGTANGNIVFGGSAVAANTASGSIVFGGNATAATYFTSEVSGPIAFSGSAAGNTPTTLATGPIVFGGAIDPSKLDVTGGTIEGSTLNTPIVFAGAADGRHAFSVTGLITFSGSATGALDVGTVEIATIRASMSLAGPVIQARFIKGSE